jgi:hypothetical protein
MEAGSNVGRSAWRRLADGSLELVHELFGSDLGLPQDAAQCPNRQFSMKRHGAKDSAKFRQNSPQTWSTAVALRQ